MTLDEELRRAFDTLAARLRDDVAGHAQAVVEGLIATAESERIDAVAQAARDAWAAAEREGAGRYEAGLADAHELARTDFRTQTIAAHDRLIGAITAMDQAQSLSEILDVLLTSASAEAPRAGLFLPNGDQMRCWRLTGFATTLQEDSPLVLSRSDAGVIADAAETGRVAAAGDSSSSVAPAFADVPDGRWAVAVPMQMSGQVFAVLYVDRGQPEAGGADSWPATVEVLTRYAARCLEVITATRLARVDLHA